MAKPYLRKGSRFWWIAPWIQGKQVPRSSREIDYDRAERQLKILEGKIAANAPITPKTDRDSFVALLELVRKDYKIKRRATLCELEARIDRHINPAIGLVRVLAADLFRAPAHDDGMAAPYRWWLVGPSSCQMLRQDTILRIAGEQMLKR